MALKIGVNEMSNFHFAFSFELKTAKILMNLAQ